MAMADPPDVRDNRSPFEAEPLVGVEEAFSGEQLDDADREGAADIEAGRFAKHAAVRRWLSSWGTEKELPPPRCGK